MDLKKYIRAIPDFPKSGITFRDISPLLASPSALAVVIDQMAASLTGMRVDRVAGLDARGFIFGPLLAARLGVPFVMIRKAGKLPGETVQAGYDLEYGSATVEMQRDAVSPGDHVVIVDDLLATGGTLAAAAALVHTLGGIVASHIVLIELEAFGGRKVLAPHPVASLLTYGSQKGSVL